MKKLPYLLLILINFSNLLIAQDKISLGVNAGLAIPVADLSDTQKFGFEFGGICCISTKISFVKSVVGCRYTIFPGRTKTNNVDGINNSFTHMVDHNDFNPFTILLGPQIEINDFTYFLLAITSNYEEEWRLGLDIELSESYPIGMSNILINIGTKFSYMNIAGKEKGEGSVNAFRMVIGVYF